MATIEFDGQRFQIPKITNMDMAFIHSMFESDGNLIFDSQKMSEVVERIVEVLIPQLSKKLYKITSRGKYLWLDEVEKLAKLIETIDLCYTQHFASDEFIEVVNQTLVERDLIDQYTLRTAGNKPLAEEVSIPETIELIDIPEPSPESEIEMLKKKLAVLENSAANSKTKGFAPAR